MNWEDNLQKLKNICFEAGEAIMNIYHAEDQGLEHKADASPLTLADKNANNIICEALKQMTLDIPIISEENKQIAFEERKKFESFWLIDPLDGTKEFVKRNGEFTVNIALIKNQSPIAGLVYAPVTKELYYAHEGTGAFKQTEEKISQIKAKSFRSTDLGLRIMSSRSHLNEKTEAYIKQFRETKIIQSGSSIKFMKIAEGNADIYPRLAPTMEWDTAAAHAILLEAGGMIIDDETDKELLYNKESLRNPHFIAYGDLEEIEISF